jgi:hypothetical protein
MHNKDCAFEMVIFMKKLPYFSIIAFILYHLPCLPSVVAADKDCANEKSEISVETEVDKLNEYWNKIIKQAAPDWNLAYYTTGVENSVCRKTTPNLDEIENWLVKQKKSISNNNSSIFGYNFTNEDSRYLVAFEKLTAKYPIPRPAKSICKDVLCAVYELFGKEVGNRLLYLYLKHGFNAGPSEPADLSLTLRDLEDITQSIEDFPPTAFHPAKTNLGLSQSENDIWAITLVSDDFKYNTVNFTKTWAKLSDKEARQYTATHEFAHLIDTSYGKLSAASDWRKISGRDPLNKFSSEVNPKSAVSTYGMNNLNEDFAESVAAYRYNPKLLLGRSKEKYQFIKYAVYDGIEYLSSKQCDGAKSLSQEILNRFGDLKNNSNFESQINSYLTTEKNIDSESIRKTIIKRIKLQLNTKQQN